MYPGPQAHQECWSGGQEPSEGGIIINDRVKCRYRIYYIYGTSHDSMILESINDGSGSLLRLFS